MNMKNWNALLQNCRTQSTLKQIHAQALTKGLFPHHQPLACKLLNVYTQLGKTDNALKVFDLIPQPDIVSWTSLISLQLHSLRPDRALSAFTDLVNHGLTPDGFSVAGALCACSRSRNLPGGRAVHAIVIRLHLSLGSPVVGNALIDMYCRCREIGEALEVFRTMEAKDVGSWTTLLNGFLICDDFESAAQLFKEMPQRNSVTWTAMITGCVRGKTPHRALEIFREMRVEGKDEPTPVTIVAALSGCADIGALDFGRCIHSYVRKSYVNLVSVNNTLLDMYTKSGVLEAAMKLFIEMPEKDLFSWTAMISGLALHGKGSQALEVFSEMMKLGVAPNEVTFISVLSACSHSGLVAEGRRLFYSMIDTHGIEPKIEHYGCMVSLLCRGGLVGEAKELIEQMPVRPDAVVWRSLLSACLVCKDLELAAMAGEKVLELEPDDDGVFVLLWNIYCSANKWEEALKVRKMMRDHKLKKRPGCSWVELNGVVHEFLVESALHFIQKEAFLALETMAEHMKLYFDPFILE